MFLNQKGMSLVEMLVSSILVVSIFSALLLFFQNSRRQMKAVSQTSSVNKNMIYFMQSLLFQSKSYQPYPVGTDCFAGTVETNSQCDDYSTMYDRMPFAITQTGGLESVSDCATCSRRAGVFLVPFRSSSVDVKGMFKVILLGISKDSNNGYTVFFEKQMLIPAT